MSESVNIKKKSGADEWRRERGWRKMKNITVVADVNLPQVKTR